MVGEDMKQVMQNHLNARYQDAPLLGETSKAHALLQSMVAHGSCRDFQEAIVPDDVLTLLCAVAMASPTKSDLQQRDIIIVKSKAVQNKLSELVAGQAWVSNAPMLLVFCGNNRRQRQLHAQKGVSFANDHLDAFFNAVGDAAIALGAFVAAADALGLGSCPISAVRNEAQAVSDLLELPNHVFPFAGLALGYPKSTSPISMRLPLSATCHVDRFCDDKIDETIASYDAARHAAQPYANQRFTDVFGESGDYGWSDDKVRQYSQEERANFGSFIKGQGFCLD